MSLPDQRPADLVGQPSPLAGWPTEPAVTPAAVELYAERGPVVYVPDAYGQMVPMFKSLLPAPTPPPPPRDLSPQPLFDPMAQRLFGGGALAAGAGWGLSLVVDALAAGGSALILFAAILVAARITSGGRGSTNITQTVHHHNRWFGRSNTNLKG